MNYLELLELVKKGKNPKKVKVWGIIYEWQDADYYSYAPKNSLSRIVVNMLNMKYGLCGGCYIIAVNDILDQSEKKYLSQVIRPFKDDVKHIVKLGNIIDKEQYIDIVLKSREEINLPYFKNNYMYKNMEQDKEYTLEELGLK